MVKLLGQDRIRNTIIAALVIMIGDITINLLGIGDSGFIGSMNTVIIVVIAGLATVLSVYYWSLLKKADPIEKVWRMLGLGLGVWTIAEIIWSILTLIGSEIPYPSVADALWAAGYFLFFLSFIHLYRLVQVKPNARTVAASLGISLLYAGVVVVYVVMPILQDPASSWVEKALGIFYPIGDLVIALSATLLALALIGGAFSWVWLFIAGGFLSISLSDTVFTYADWNGLYFPDERLNWLSFVVDMTYVLGYILVAIGVYTQIEFAVNDVEESLVDRYRSMLDEQDDSLPTVTITFFTDAENRIIAASPTVAYLLPPESRSRDLNGMAFQQAAGLDEEFARRLLQDMRDAGPQTNRPSNVRLADRQSVKARISGFSNFNVADRYIGSDITMTFRINPDLIIDGIGPADPSTSPLEDTLAPANVVEKVVSHFFVGKIHTLYVIVFRFGGINAAKSMQRIFNSNASRLKTSVQMDGPNVIFDPTTHDLPAYRELLKTVINYAIAIASLDVVNREVSRVENKLEPDLLQKGKDAGLYGSNLEGQSYAIS